MFGKLKTKLLKGTFKKINLMKYFVKQSIKIREASFNTFLIQKMKIKAINTKRILQMLFHKQIFINKA